MSNKKFHLSQEGTDTSIELPVLSEIDLARDPSLSVSVNPGRILFIVMQGLNSLERDFAHEPIAPLSVFESPILSIGSLTDVEIIFTILP